VCVCVCVRVPPSVAHRPLLPSSICCVLGHRFSSASRSTPTWVSGKRSNGRWVGHSDAILPGRNCLAHSHLSRQQHHGTSGATVRRHGAGHSDWVVHNR
jgi:hypothetical protein